MDVLNKEQVKLVAGASGAYDPAYAGASAKASQHGSSYGGQANGFVGTHSCGLELETLIRENSCAAGIAAGIISGGGNVVQAIKGIAVGVIGGMCFSGGNRNGGGSGSNNYGAQCTG